MPLLFIRGINLPFGRLVPCAGQVPYALRTRAPVAGGLIAEAPLPLDLHVLGLSLAFILSQDQTLRCMTLFLFLFQGLPRHRGGPPLLYPRSAGGVAAAPPACCVRHFQYVNVLWLRLCLPRFSGAKSELRS